MPHRVCHPDSWARWRIQLKASSIDVEFAVVGDPKNDFTRNNHLCRTTSKMATHSIQDLWLDGLIEMTDLYPDLSGVLFVTSSCIPTTPGKTLETFVKMSNTIITDSIIMYICSADIQVLLNQAVIERTSLQSILGDVIKPIQDYPLICNHIDDDAGLCGLLLHNVPENIIPSPLWSSFPWLYCEVGVLFLAHLGITQPQVWLAWQQYLLKSYGIVMRFGVVGQANNTLIPRLDDVRVNLNDAWCELPLVDALRLGLRSMLQTYQSCQFVFFVSGSCIPIGFGSLIQDVVAVGKSCFAFVHDHQEHTVLREHTQWVHLTRAHAKVIADVEDLTIFNIVSNHIMCPDEYIPWTILQHHNLVHEIDDNPLTDMRHIPKKPSPITWINFRRQPSTRHPLHTVLISSNEMGFLFFRKVSATLKGKVPNQLIHVLPWLSTLAK